ncbi:mannosyl-glycoprotein endo-beta-N-acetylglucosamidase [[Clostridium] sordellii]|nr:mannosyl-glycoprotein endo-beta-N-acetylglucosamidase [[Clostridium] sordellii] [Paeniclostridium sordellii]CEO22155.1 mannosyl-glycoprotein endo-beta-N-acetylglucosamidase [[Clostridium] sordellii] [Paeniclostridium sordellii]CEO36128.1 mannosyl-glycoprotein endo-beta-N-acetylglucosamidase [[Clostridium] sordellii] [Paeniclostridium sordellii]CEP92387.1 mannosyl-glycoprotein endo-beta-N-acetylglucosamidase [[Clostridium] sordellii] [Paeniclostridium sordellii]CEQ14082.1 mannosyl-glycoprotei
MLKRRIAMATLALIPFTATNAFASNQEGIVTATSLNVRSGPSTDSSFLFSIKKNDKVTILKSENGWYKISTANGHEGWASSEYISTNTSDTNQQSNKKVVNVDNLNMRNGASTSYRVIMKLNKGTVIEIISESNGWTKIKHDGRIGFVASKYLSPIENNNQTTKPEQQPNVPVQPQVSVGKTKVVVATSLNVRSGPSTGNSVIGSLKNNEKVEVISESNGWSKIKYNGKEGYVSSTYLKDSNEGGNSKPNENPKPSPNVGTKIKVVAATSLNVRSGPSTSHGIIGSLKNNEKVEVISESNGWSKIKYNGKEGYVSSTYLKDSNEGGTSKPDEKPNVGTKIKVVAATSLNVRSGPSTSHGIIGSLKNNEKVEVISESNGWSKIKYNGKEGYVSSTYLKDSNEGGTSKPDEKPNVGTKIKVVAATSLNVRSGPSTGHGIIGSLKNNEKVEVISESNGWSKIKYNGKEGYVSSTYLKDSNEGGTVTPPEQTKTKVVTATSLNVRSGPSTGHGIIGSLKNNEKVEVISESNGWSKIKYNGKEGYVSSTYLTDYQGGGTNPGGGSGGSSSEVVNGATVNYRNLSYSLQDHVNKQASKGNGNMISGRGFVQASRSDIEHYINPKNFTSSKSGMLQFLRLDSYKGGISASELNGYLNSLSPASSGTNVFYNQGQAFLDAARKYNIDVVYLVGHSMVETGYGKSTLAQGQVLTSYKGSPLPKPVKVYNFFGIGAFDGTANLSGAEAAYKNGWTTVEKTIEGSAKWLSQNYIHNGGYDQNTLYKMRWSYEHLWHQYATDVNWANVISSVMSRLVGMYDTNSNLVYEVPVHR